MPDLDRWPHTPFRTELANYRLARDDAANNPVDIMYWGNSLTQGVYDTEVNGGFPARVGNMLNAKLGKQHGVGYEPCRTNQGSSKWVLTNTSGTSTGADSNLIGYGQWTTKLGIGDTVSLTATMDRFELLYTKIQAGGGTIEVKIDGVAQTTLDSTGVAQTDTYDSSCSWDSGALSDASHTILLTNTGSGFCYIEGAFLYRGNYSNGFRVWNGGTAGKWGGVPTEASGALDILAKRTPDLAVWCHFYNDKGTSFLPIENFYGRWIDNFVNSVREKSPNTDILLCSEWQTNLWLSTYADYDAMRQLMKDKAAEHGVAYLDLGDFVESVGYNGTRTDPFSWLLPDGSHQTVAGFKQWAQIHYNFLTDTKPVNRPQGFTPAVDTDVMSNILTGWTTDPIHGVWVDDPLWSPPADGALVSSWRNGGTVGGDLTSSGAARPTYRAVAAVSDGQSAIQFAGSHRIGVNITDVPQTHWVVALAAIAGATGTNERIVGTGTNSATGLGDTAANAWDLSAGTSVASGTSNASAHCFVAKFAGASSTLHIDGAAVASGNAGAASLLTFNIGSGTNSTMASFSNYMTGYVHAVLVFDTDPTAQTEWPLFVAYCATLGITVV